MSRHSTPTTQEEVKKELEDYLDEKGISNVFIHIVEHLLLQKPDNPIQFIIDHLSAKYPEAVSKGAPTQKSSVVGSVAGKEGNGLAFSSDDEDTEDDDDDISDIRSIPVVRRTRRRTAVSAACLTASTMQDHESKSFEKTPEQSNRITTILRKNMIFQSLDTEQMQVVVNAFVPLEFSEGQDIITQGDPGDMFYLLESGEAQVWVSKGGAEPTNMLTYANGSGATFGELALMYNAPRAATVRASTDVKVWALDQVTFKSITVGSVQQRYERQIEFLRNVKILSEMSEEERREAAAALTRRQFNTGQVIVRQGDRGNDFYIVETGEVVCTQQESPDRPPREVLRLLDGDYFGEIALLTNRPRQATVTAVQPTTVLSMDRATFKRLLGPLKSILQRNMNSYKEFVTEHV